MEMTDKEIRDALKWANRGRKVTDAQVEAFKAAQAAGDAEMEKVKAAGGDVFDTLVQDA